jgi:hypothetical protein
MHFPLAKRHPGLRNTTQAGGRSSRLPAPPSRIWSGFFTLMIWQRSVTPSRRTRDRHARQSGAYWRQMTVMCGCIYSTQPKYNSSYSPAFCNCLDFAFSCGKRSWFRCIKALVFQFSSNL